MPSSTLVFHPKLLFYALFLLQCQYNHVSISRISKTAKRLSSDARLVEGTTLRLFLQCFFTVVHNLNALPFEHELGRATGTDQLVSQLPANEANLVTGLGALMISSGPPLSYRELITNLLRVFLTHGANPNHQNRYGSYVTGIDVLIGLDADLDIMKADGITPRKIYAMCGP
ncbi:hypothetical protein BDP27DRAFT_1359668 [Rhodocollybia butyracea]|uniref:Uncharacterized protein n=1 Tax=Rhodocollybia butyracea TaxID=206335 RepID=A0A9P5UBI1_9AGAR|nr:hypothetical protein BDP27DRAFT_1359668 [Rhodocollybia butyracea]